MADNESPTKVEEEKEGSAEAEAEELLSLESLDELIASEDPDFASSLSGIGPDENIEIYNEGLQLEYTLADETNLWKGAKGFRKRLATVFPFLPVLAFKSKIKRTELRLRWIKWRGQAVQNVKTAAPRFLAWSKQQVQSGLQIFGSFSKIKKFAFVGLIALTFVSGFVVYKVATEGILPHPKELFISSLSEWSRHQYKYDPKTELESFYDSPRTAQNILLMKKMVANLRRSAQSGENPMGAFEFFVEGAATEVIVEIKDRESEMKDLFLRTIEEMTFDSVSSGEGKRYLCESLRKELNKVLTKGYVRRIFIKTAIVKP